MAGMCEGDRYLFVVFKLAPLAENSTHSAWLWQNCVIVLSCAEGEQCMAQELGLLHAI